MITPRPRIIIENELIWPSDCLEHRLNDHPRYTMDAPMFMLFMGSAKKIRLSGDFQSYLNNGFFSYFGSDEIEYIYENHIKNLVEHLSPGDKEETWHFRIMIESFLTFLIYSSKYKRPFVADINSLIELLDNHRKKIFQGKRRGNAVLAGNIINLLSCYSSISPYCVRPVEPNIQVANDLFGELSSNVNYNLLSRITYKIGMQPHRRIGKSIEKTRSLADEVSKSKAFTNMLAVTKSFVSLWFGPSGTVGADAVHKLVSVIPLTRYIPPIYDIREIHIAYDHYTFPDTDDYGGL